VPPRLSSRCADRHKSIRRQVCTLAIAFITGCGLIDGGPTVCTADFRFGLAVYVKDSLSGAWAASGAQLQTDINGVIVDSTSFPGQPASDSFPLLGAGERAGVYRVTVRKTGYTDWVRTGVRVTEDECHVRRTTLTARLQRSR
jgi:hypothetical protein